MYKSLSYKSKQFFWLIIKLSIVIGCGYFIYIKLLENKQLNFSVFTDKMVKNNVFLSKNLFFLFLFTFFNHFLEILKWKELVSYLTKISFYEALKQNLASLTTSLITPNRIGEYGAKALYFKKNIRKQIVGLNFVGNFYQMIATLFFGSIGFIFFIIQHSVYINFFRIFKLILLLIFLFFLIYWLTKKIDFKGYSWSRSKNFIKKIPLKLNLKVGFISFLRFIIFSHQFYFLLFIFNIDISYINAISAIVSVYFIASIVPMLSLFDVVLKGTVAVWIFTYFTIDALTVLSITTLMWIFNFVIPAILGSYFVIIFKPNFTK